MLQLLDHNKARSRNGHTVVNLTKWLATCLVLFINIILLAAGSTLRADDGAAQESENLSAAPVTVSATVGGRAIVPIVSITLSDEGCDTACAGELQISASGFRDAPTFVDFVDRAALKWKSETSPKQPRAKAYCGIERIEDDIQYSKCLVLIQQIEERIDTKVHFIE